MNKTKLFLLALMALVVAACATDTVDESGVVSPEAIIAKKFINNSTSALPGELIIYVDGKTADMLLDAECATRSGVVSLDNFAAEVGATLLKPVFNLKVNGEVKRKRGMHRWFTVYFPAETDLEEAAQSLAKCDEVESVQFATKVVRPAGVPVEVDPATMAASRATVWPFNDEMLPAQWHYYNDGGVEFPNAKAGADINLLSAWELTTGNPDVVVAVVDEGVCYTHADLVANMHINEAELNGEESVDDDGNGYVDDVYGYNFVDRGRITWSRNGDSGHGTHVAGTIAAVNNNGIGVAGVAGGSGNGDGVRVFSCQIISGGNSAGVNATAEAVEYAADRGASILQNSWGFESGAIANDAMFENGTTGVEWEAFQYFMSNEVATPRHPNLDGGIIIFAAGNDGKSVAGYPAAYNKLIAVSAIAPDGLPTFYTCYDRGCNVSAPGGEYYANGGTTGVTGCVLSTIPGNKYGYMQGTSMACPHVSGIAALALSYAADNGIMLTVPEFKDIIVSSVSALEFDGTKPNFMTNGTMNLKSYQNKMGTGLIDAYRALMAVRRTTCIPVALDQPTVIDMGKHLGDGNLSIRMVESEIPEEVITKLGITDYEFKGGKLSIHCTKAGSALVTLKYIAGGNVVGGGQITGGMEAEQEFALLVRPGIDLDEESGSPIVNDGWL